MSGFAVDNDPLAPPTDGEPDELADPESAARIICLKLLDIRARTRAELAKELRRRNVPDLAATTVLDRFTELGLIDDAALASSFARARHEERGHAGRAIAVQLRRRGIAADVISDAVAQIDPSSEAATARLIARTRLARMGAVDAAVAIRRLTGLLARRGYSFEVAAAAVRAVLQERDGSLDLELVD